VKRTISSFLKCFKRLFWSVKKLCHQRCLLNPFPQRANLLSHELKKSRHMQSLHVYEVRPRKDRRGVDLISDALPFGRLWYRGPDAISSLRRLDPARQNGDDVFH
jgi:hypothetical protein